MDIGYSPRGRKESDTTERLHFYFLSARLQGRGIRLGPPRSRLQDGTRCARD